LAIYLTQVTPTYSVRAREGLSAGSGRIRTTLRDRRGVPAVPGAAALARRLSLPALWPSEGVAGPRWSAVALRRLWSSDVGDRRNDFPRHADAAADVVSSHVVGHQPEDRRQCLGHAACARSRQLQDGVDLVAQVAAGDGSPPPRPIGGTCGSGEAYIGGAHPGRPGRQTETKALVAVAVQIEQRRLGRIRLRQIPDASGPTLMAFVQDAIDSKSLVHTDGWNGYQPLRRHGYKHRITYLEGQSRSPAQLMPHVHQVVSLLKRWLLGTHHGGVTHEHLDYYLDEFTFRFNRRRSRSRGKLFFRLVEQAVAVEPAPYESLVKYARLPS